VLLQQILEEFTPALVTTVLVIAQLNHPSIRPVWDAIKIEKSDLRNIGYRGDVGAIYLPVGTAMTL